MSDFVLKIVLIARFSFNCEWYKPKKQDMMRREIN